MKLSAPLGKTQALAATLLLLGTLFISACSLGFEHIGGYQPCKLCYMQRHVHYAMIPFSAITLALIWMRSPAFIIRLLLLAGAAILAYGAAVGVYQAGAEWEFWMGPADCANTVAITNDVSNLLGQLQSTKLINCSVAQLRILGLSFGGWNVVLSAVLIGIALIGSFAKGSFLSSLYGRIPFVDRWTSALLRSK